MITSNNLKVAIHDSATEGLVQHGFGKSGVLGIYLKFVLYF